jgi:RNA polymerase sigma-70 factor (ECF subfamily)
VSEPERASALTDEELLLRLESGERAAAAVLFDRYAALLFGIGQRILQDRSEAEDLVQDLFLGLVDRIKGFDPSRGSARTWIIQIAYRRAFDRRAYLTRRSYYDGTDYQRVTNTIQAETGSEEQIAASLTGEQLHAAFEELNEKQQATLQLFFFEGLEFREISERLGETLENTRHFYYRGLERLRRSVAGLARRDVK